MFRHWTTDLEHVCGSFLIPRAVFPDRTTYSVPKLSIENNRSASWAIRYVTPGFEKALVELCFYALCGR